MKAKKNRTVPPPKQIFLVDDHPIMRQGLAQLIDHEQDLAVCGEADCASTALEKINRTKPDLVLTDISMPGKNGIEFIKDLQIIHRDLPVLVLSMHDESMYAERVLKAGGRGYVMKHEGAPKLLEAIRAVLAGRISVSDHIASKILEMFSGQQAKIDHSPMNQLSDREFEVFQLLGKGLSTKEIAGHLNLSVKTVEVHRVNIKAKLKIKTAHELILHAVRWVESEDSGGLS